MCLVLGGQILDLLSPFSKMCLSCRHYILGWFPQVDCEKLITYKCNTPCSITVLMYAYMFVYVSTCIHRSSRVSSVNCMSRVVRTIVSCKYHQAVGGATFILAAAEPTFAIRILSTHLMWTLQLLSSVSYQRNSHLWQPLEPPVMKCQQAECQLQVCTYVMLLYGCVCVYHNLFLYVCM